MTLPIPLHQPFWGKREEKALVNAISHGQGVGDGPYSQKLRQKLKKLTGAKFVWPVTSCTHAMEMAVACLGVKPGQEVICPSFTLSATALAFVNRGAEPVFADIDAKTYCLDPADVERCITKRTAGIMVVHYAGMAYKIPEILKIAQKYRLWVVEDAAHAIGAFYRGRALGTFGNAGAYSFHGTKNIACGEGGAVVTNDPQLAAKMDVYRAIGTNRQAFLEGKVSLYHWVGKGSSFMLSDILASLVTIQLSQINKINKLRHQIASLYNSALGVYQNFVQLPIVPEGITPNWHIYTLKFKTADQRKKFVTAMKQKGIEVATHFVPLHTSPMGLELGGGRRKLPVTEEVAQTLVRLPIYPGLTKTQLQYILTSAQRILRQM